MGCDIHGFVEVKCKGKWYVFDNIDMGVRNYRLFSIIANVRNFNNIVPISEPKGVPSDSSVITKREVEEWKEDGHSHTWLSREEMEEVYKRFDNYIKHSQKKEKEEIKEAWLVFGIESLIYKLLRYGTHFLDENKQYTDVRMVIWFDN